MTPSGPRTGIPTAGASRRTFSVGGTGPTDFFSRGRPWIATGESAWTDWHSADGTPVPPGFPSQEWWWQYVVYGGTTWHWVSADGAWKAIKYFAGGLATQRWVSVDVFQMPNTSTSHRLHATHYPRTVKVLK